MRVKVLAVAIDMIAAGTRAPMPMAAKATPTNQSGNIAFCGRLLKVGGLLHGEPVSLRPIADGVHAVFYGPHCLGFLHARDKTPRLRPEPQVHAPKPSEDEVGASVDATEAPEAAPAPTVTGEEVPGV